jgi:hypothetical protein
MQRLTTWTIRYCRYHQEVKEFMNGFNDIQLDDKGIHDTCNYTCAQVCAPTIGTIDTSKSNAHCTTYISLTYLWIIIVCVKLLDMQWYNFIAKW